MEKFKELCEQYQTGYRQRPLPHQRQLQNNTGQSGQVKLLPYMEYKLCVVWVWVCVCMLYACVFVYVCVCLYTCVCLYACVYVHMQTHTITITNHTYVNIYITL